MSLYFLAFFLLILFILLSGIFVYIRYKKTSGLYYLIFAIVIPLWFLLYFLSFNLEFGADNIMRIYRFQYSLSLIGFYSILFFICFYAINWQQHRYTKYIFAFFISLLAFSNLTPFIVSGVEFSNELGSYVEIFGSGYAIFVGLYIAIFPLFFACSYLKLRKLNNLDRVRIWYIIVGFLLFIGVSLTFLVFVPFIFSDADLLLFENLTPFFILPFIISVIYSSYKYDFSDVKIYVNSLFIYGSSLALACAWLFLTHYLISYLGERFHVFWDIAPGFGWMDIILGIIFFLFFIRIFQRFRVGDELDSKLRSIQDTLPFITDMTSINISLKDSFKKKLHISDVRIEDNTQAFPNIIEFFLGNPEAKYIINDFVFFEKNKHKIGNIFSEVTVNDMLVFPIFKSFNDLRALLFIGKKTIRDSYTSQELGALHNFSVFLGGYFKFLSVYKKVQDLSVSLDKKVDEKTIEINNLLSKQKEFIAYVGHEIKNPITNTLFLSDSIKQDIEGKVDDDIFEDAGILYDELVKVSKLVKYIFSAEKFDLDKVKLYKDDINISKFMQEELHHFQHTHMNINFVGDIQEDIFVSMDETQFRQVIQNLVNNSIKFTSTLEPEILLSLKKEEKNIYITIEDNGEGFKPHEAENIFGKYVTGSGSATGLGMGLYLCKKIIELHDGEISAGISKRLSGAQFSIKL